MTSLDKCTYLDNSSTSVAKFLHDVIDAVAGTDTRVLLVSCDEPEIRHALTHNVRESFTEYKITHDDVRSDIAAYSWDIVNRKLPNKNDDVRSTLSEAIPIDAKHAIEDTPTGLRERWQNSACTNKKVADESEATNLVRP
ncbi:hypothetical protein BKA56DRAFT_622016 [Ilyonectria sp. MPI-CAGE-AT-0026]|nr:hypothetical protein BKA56DRAFT_622016 [Ilyonectria sp. MPI-CAGE-AT-0026]